MKNILNYELRVENEDGEVLGKIDALSLDSLQEQIHKIEKVAEDNSYTCDTCGEIKPLRELIELAEDDHICEECNEAEEKLTQQDLD